MYAATIKNKNTQNVQVRIWKKIQLAVLSFQHFRALQIRSWSARPVRRCEPHCDFERRRFGSLQDQPNNKSGCHGWPQGRVASRTLLITRFFLGEWKSGQRKRKVAKNEREGKSKQLWESLDSNVLQADNIPRLKKKKKEKKTNTPDNNRYKYNPLDKVDIYCTESISRRLLEPEGGKKSRFLT